jgi:hypothetical protein
VSNLLTKLRAFLVSTTELKEKVVFPEAAILLLGIVPKKKKML